MKFNDGLTMIRPLLRRVLYTPNTLRYRLEWPRLEEAFRRIEAVETLFDGGAGSGEFALCALKAGFCRKVIALEYDRENFERLKGNLGRRREATLIHGSLLEVPLPDESAEVVMSTQVLEHIEAHERAAAELVRVLKPGGHAIITVPHPPEPFPNTGHVREGYTEGDLRALFEPLGMTLLHTDYYLTKSTIGRVLAAARLPMNGVFMPVAWADREQGLKREQRQQQEPFGILALFRKEPGGLDR